MSEILMVPFHGQGHLFPCSELCKHLASRNYRITFLIPSSLFSSISSSLCQHSLVQIAQLPVPTPSPDSDPMHNHGHMAQSLSDFLSSRSDDPDYLLPVCAVVDVMMSWTTETFQKFKIPIVSFFTSGACSAAMEYALWKLQPLPEKLTPGDTLIIPGLPEDMCFTCSDLTHKDQPPPPHHRGGGPPSSQQHGRGPPPSSQQHGGGPPPPHHRGGGFPPPPGPPPIPGHRPPWVSETEDSIALLMNTCDDLERPFIDYVANQTGKPVWGVGPLLPEQYWRSADSLVHDRDIRSKRESNVTEEEVSEWLDSKPRQSVIYVSFGSEVCPTAKELAELAEALDKSSQPFIWVVQSNLGKPGPPGGPPGPHGGPPDDGDGGDFSPDDLASRAEGRGLIIRGWAPQLLILSHPSTAGFITHCGWNSIVEAIGRGVPLLAWPIRGDQPFNAKLIVTHLKVGLMIQGGDQSEPIRKDDILNGIEKLMADKETRKRAASLRTTFDHGFPPTSVASLDAFRDFISENC